MPGDRHRTAGVVRVLQSLDPPDGTTKFAVQMAEGATDDVELTFFSWRAALLGRYDVVHVHWPEFLFRAGTRRRRVVKRMLGTLLVARWQLTRTPVVRTVHNEDPHEAGGAIERLLTGRLLRRTARFVVLNPFTATPDPTRTVLIKHGHYRDWFGALPGAGDDGRLLSFGLLRPYKGIEKLIAAFRDVSDADASLRVVGRPVDAAFARQVVEAADRDDRVDLWLEFVSDADLLDELQRARLVVLPYEHMHNSGVMLVALSVHRPVLVPRNQVTEWIAQEVGPGWVHFFDDEITTESLRLALQAVQDRSGVAEPRFAGRDWLETGARYAEVYRSAGGAR